MLGRQSSAFLLPDMDLLLKTLIRKENPVIFDIGANEGQSIKRFKRLFSDSIIFAFEPIPELAQKLKVLENSNGTIKVFELGCSDRNEIGTLSINSHSGNSSLLPLILRVNG